MSTGGNEGDPWWASAVVYQVYPRSFADADGDGIGDLPGLVGRLPYLAELGVDAIWLSPFYPSPLNDGGYDVSDYTDVDPRLGTLADFDAARRSRQRAPDQGHRRSGAEPLLVGPSAVQEGAGGAAGQRRAGAVHLPRRPGARRRRAAEQLALPVRRPGLDPGAGRPVVPAPVRLQPARLELARPPGRRDVRGDPPVLAGPRDRRVPGGRRARPVQGPAAGRRRRRRR